MHYALLRGAPAATFDKLQCAQNNLGRVVCQSRCLTDARLLLCSLHWLPVRQRVTYKVALLTHKLRTTATQRITDPCTTSAFFRCSADGRSSHTPNWPVALLLLLVRPPGTLPADIRLHKNILTFKRHLKTHLFKLT